MNKKNTAGVSLVEVLVAIVILGILSAPVCTSLVLSTRMNVKATELLEAQLAVSSAVETLMAEGIQLDSATKSTLAPNTSVDYSKNADDEIRFEGITVTVTPQYNDDKTKRFLYYSVKIESEDGIIVDTFIREEEYVAAGGGTQ